MSGLGRSSVLLKLLLCISDLGVDPFRLTPHLSAPSLLSEAKPFALSTFLYQYVHSGPGDWRMPSQMTEFWVFFFYLNSPFSSHCHSPILAQPVLEVYARMISQMLNPRLPCSPQLDTAEAYPTGLTGTALALAWPWTGWAILTAAEWGARVLIPGTTSQAGWPSLKWDSPSPFCLPWARHMAFTGWGDQGLVVRVVPVTSTINHFVHSLHFLASFQCYYADKTHEHEH